MTTTLTTTCKQATTTSRGRKAAQPNAQYHQAIPRRDDRHETNDQAQEQPKPKPAGTCAPKNVRPKASVGPSKETQRLWKRGRKNYEHEAERTRAPAPWSLEAPKIRRQTSRRRHPADITAPSATNPPTRPTVAPQRKAAPARQWQSTTAPYWAMAA